MVRIYLTEGERLLDTLITRLHDRERVWGLTVFRGISGFGKKGQMHQARLVDISFDLPLVVEFFDDPERAKEIIDHLAEVIDPGHIVSWSATLTDGSERDARS